MAKPQGTNHQKLRKRTPLRRAFRRAHAVQRSCGRGVVSSSMTVVQFLHPLLHPRAGITPPSQFGGARATGYTNTTAKVKNIIQNAIGGIHGPLGDVLTSDNCTVLQTAHGFTTATTSDNCTVLQTAHGLTNGTRFYKWRGDHGSIVEVWFRTLLVISVYILWYWS